MMKLKRGVALLAFMGIATAGTANAGEVLVTNDIAVDTVWTANHRYNLQNQIYVLEGASLTIEAGTIVASTPTVNGGGSLAVIRGAQIFVNGSVDKPVIMTSTNDTATWTGGDPKTGTWRPACSEWGNLTVMGRAYISENAFGNAHACNALNFGRMEGLTDPDIARTSYGGGNDEDDSGVIKYLSLRYGGRVVGVGDELNALSMGGVGRGTTVHHIDIMNNVDDGIETWGGTVNYKYVNIWNSGDDSFDVDQGWRGKAQFGLIVQGYSCDAARGSGGSDNCFEIDGAESADYQPVTTATVYNFTCIGNPLEARRGTAWRDGARVQFRNCIFMNLGLELLHNDGTDGDSGSGGYGTNATLPFFDANNPDIWDTDWSVHSPVNACMDPSAIYQAQTSGKLAEITDSVFFANNNAAAYTEATQVGVMPAMIGTNNNVLAVASPITSITRGPDPLLASGYNVLPVIGLDPRAANDAVTSVGMAPNDGFFCPVQYRGAFSPTTNWLCSWTAAYAFGYSRPDDCCRLGNINGGAGAVTDVLFLNGSVGGPTRTFQITPSTPFTLTMAQTPLSGRRYVTYIWVGTPNPGTARNNPQGIGTTCFPTPITSGSPQPRPERANNIGAIPQLGAENWPGPPTQPAPYTLLNFPAGINRTGTFFFQGFELDPGAPNGQAGVTNGFLVISQ